MNYVPIHNIIAWLSVSVKSAFQIDPFLLCCCWISRSEIQNLVPLSAAAAQQDFLMIFDFHRVVSTNWWIFVSIILAMLVPFKSPCPANLTPKRLLIITARALFRPWSGHGPQDGPKPIFNKMWTEFGRNLDRCWTTVGSIFGLTCQQIFAHVGQTVWLLWDHMLIDLCTIPKQLVSRVFWNTKRLTHKILRIGRLSFNTRRLIDKIFHDTRRLTGSIFYERGGRFRSKARPSRLPSSGFVTPRQDASPRQSDRSWVDFGSQFGFEIH